MKTREEILEMMTRLEGEREQADETKKLHLEIAINALAWGWDGEPISPMKMLTGKE